MSRYKKKIYFLVFLNIFFATILLIKIKTTPKYNPIVYDEIYDEYEEIFGEENSVQEKNTQNIQSNNSDIEESNNQITVIKGTTSSNKELGNVIGKMIIPQINVECPILNKTTKEYLEIAPTKYCGPNVNEIRKFSDSRS